MVFIEKSICPLTSSLFDFSFHNSQGTFGILKEFRFFFLIKQELTELISKR